MMADYIYREQAVTPGTALHIPDNVLPHHIRLVETDDGQYVKWLEPIYPDLTRSPLSDRPPSCVPAVDIDLGKRGSTREAIEATEGDHVW